MSGLDDRWARMLLARCSEPGDTALVRRVARVGAPQVVEELVLGESPLARAEVTAARLGARSRQGLADVAEADSRAAERIGARYVVPGDKEWPTQVDALGERAPLGLWVAGAADLRLLGLCSLAVVGARASTAYGDGIARALAGDLAVAGWTTVSGGAFGIDAAAHRGALAAGGATVCVLAGGVDVPYPRAHDTLIARIRSCGLLVSEAPLGGAPMRQRFLTRNRLIAALTRGTVVVEAALRSGSRTTASEAAKLARMVMAFPGPVTSPMSQGCHALLRTPGTLLVTSSRDVLDLTRGETSVPPEPAPALSAREARLLDAVPVRRPVGLDRLPRLAALPTDEALTALGMLEAEGLVERRAAGWLRRSPGRGSSATAPAPGTMGA